MLDQLIFHDYSDNLKNEARPVLTNYEEIDKKKVNIDPEVILQRIHEVCGDWPKVVKNKLIVEIQSKLQYLNNSNALFAWLNSMFNVQWSGSPFISKEEFMEYILQQSIQYEDITNYPHFPALKNVFYYHDEIPEPDGELTYLNGLINFFNPSSHEDYELIKAFILTVVWGSPPGQRPVFLITVPDNTPNSGVGAGKTTLAELVFSLVGGSISASHTEDRNELSKRILSPVDLLEKKRAILFDNIKSRRFSNADLESMITSRSINGHTMYKGTNSIPNNFTYAITINEASLSRDLSSRCIVIMINPISESQSIHNWLVDVTQYIETFRMNIFADCQQVLLSEASPDFTTPVTRWGLWESQVLSKLYHPLDIQQKLQSRSMIVDDDRNQKMNFYNFMLDELENVYKGTSIYSTGDSGFSENGFIFRIESKKMRELAQAFFGKNIGGNNLVKRVQELGVGYCKVHRRKSQKSFWYFHRHGEDLTPQMIHQCFHESDVVLE